MKKTMSFILVLCMAFSLMSCSSGRTPDSSNSGASSAPQAPAGVYPTQNVNGIVQWGAGGGTDSVMRPLSTLAEQNLGKSIVIQNMTGATGSVATQYVYDAPADGYTLLMGAENPTLYKAMGISDLTYDDF